MGEKDAVSVTCGVSNYPCSLWADFWKWKHNSD